MEEMQNNESRPVNPRRRKKTKMEIFKESYLPAIIVGIALLLIVIFIIGSIVQNAQRNEQTQQDNDSAAQEELEQKEKYEAEVQKLLGIASNFAAEYEYDKAIAVIGTFTGNAEDYPALGEANAKYEALKASMVAWSDPSQVLNLSFQMLIEDPVRAYADKTYKTQYNKNFITTDEFVKILDQLYSGGYMLVRMSDLVQTGKDAEGNTTYEAKTLYLPEGKKPLIITQNQVNYYQYMIDSNGDHLPDEGGAGFASKLIIGQDGKLTNQYVDVSGAALTGSYDLVPLLNDFIEAHPDFSYKGAKAIIAVSGYDGLFGYRTHSGAKKWLSEEDYQAEIEGAKKIAQALRDDGFEIACYTFGNMAYGSISLQDVQSDIQKWNSEVVPVLGQIDTIVFAQLSDIAEPGQYSGNKFEALKNAGFRYFLGFCSDGYPWATIQADYVRMGRIMVTGSTLKHNAGWFTGILDPETILDSARGNIPK